MRIGTSIVRLLYGTKVRNLLPWFVGDRSWGMSTRSIVRWTVGRPWPLGHLVPYWTFVWCGLFLWMRTEMRINNQPMASGCSYHPLCAQNGQPSVCSFIYSLQVNTVDVCQARIIFCHQAKMVTLSCVVVLHLCSAPARQENIQCDRRMRGYHYMQQCMDGFSLHLANDGTLHIIAVVCPHSLHFQWWWLSDMSQEVPQEDCLSCTNKTQLIWGEDDPTDSLRVTYEHLTWRKLHMGQVSVQLVAVISLQLMACASMLAWRRYYIILVYNTQLPARTSAVFELNIYIRTLVQDSCVTWDLC